jgi:hypothetical protein
VLPDEQAVITKSETRATMARGFPDRNM